jgi:predicted RNA-binding Zn-ribbon protein involved in translation (DUF1610 family)
MDCGKEYKYSGSDLHLICTRCGSDRFEFVDNITSSDVVESGKENPIDRAFSEKRRKLFNDEKSSSLTSLNPGPEKELQKFKCPDCGADGVVRRTKTGRKFYGCSNYPKCKWAAWKKP